MINAVQSTPLPWGISLQGSNQTTFKTESDSFLCTVVKTIGTFLRTILNFCLDLLRFFNPCCRVKTRDSQPIYFELKRYPKEFPNESDESRSQSRNHEYVQNIEQRLFWEREQRFESMRDRLSSLPLISTESAVVKHDPNGSPVDWEMFLPILEPYLEEGALHFLSQTSRFLRTYARSDIFWRRFLRERNFSCETDHYAVLTDFVNRYCRAFSTALCLTLREHPAFVAKRVIEVRMRELDNETHQNFPEYFLAKTSDCDKVLFLLESGFEPTETLFNSCVKEGCSLSTLKPFSQRGIKLSEKTIENAIWANLFSLNREGSDPSLTFKKRDFKSLMDEGREVSCKAIDTAIDLIAYALCLFEKNSSFDCSPLVKNLISIGAYLLDKAPANYYLGNIVLKTNITVLSVLSKPICRFH